jgi:hypothetical protein
MLRRMNAPPPRGIPLRPDMTAMRDGAVATLVREVILQGRNVLGDRVTRAAVSPTSTTSASALAQITQAFLATLVPFSAAADLLERGLALSFGGAAAITVPAIVPTTAGFVGEGAPIPMRQYQTNPGVTLRPCKLGTLTSLTGEMMRSSNAEAIVRQALIDSVGPALDGALFSNAAEVLQLRPAGLLAGLTPLTPASPGAKDEAMKTDLVALGSAVSVVAGRSNIVFVMNVAQAIAVGLRSLGTFSYAVLPSNTVAAGTVIAVATNAIASAVESSPTIETSQEAEVHMEDASVAQIVDDAGSVARPVRSFYQTDSVGLKLRWPLSWVVRDARGVAYMTGTNW